MAPGAGAADFEHQSVMLGEIVAAFEPVPPGVVVDATVGGGGHSEAILDARPDVSVLGLDRDPAALSAASERLARFGSRFSTYRCRFDDLETAMTAFDVDRLSGALFDLGVSSPQLDRAERGFSYRHDGPLDMRMDTDAQWSASDVVNGYEEAELRRVIRKYGDERFASRIARAIVAARPIETTTELGRGRDRRDSGGGAAHRGTSRQAHVPGDPHRGQRRARRARPGDRRRDRGRGAGRADRRAVVPLRRGPDRQGALPRRDPAPANARPTCPASAARCRPSVSCEACAARRRTEEKAGNRRAASARLRVAERTEPTRRGGGR